MTTARTSAGKRVATSPDSGGLVLSELLNCYERSQRPITVSFRRLVDWVPGGERATHMIHPYPAKLLPQIAHLFAANSLLSRPGDTILDPFCGSGTVLLEAALAGRHSIGTDANPLARLIAQVKVRRLSPESILRASKSLFRRIPSIAKPPEVVNLEYWFYPHVVAQMSRLACAIERTGDPEVRAFFAVCLSSCVRRVSLADPRLTVPVRLRRNQYERGHWLYLPTVKRLNRLRRQNVFEVFSGIMRANVRRMAEYFDQSTDEITADVIGTDARVLRDERDTQIDRSSVSRDSVDLIVTSPPYAGAQKYVRASSLSLGWLKLGRPADLRALEDRNIGREHFPTTAHAKAVVTGIGAADRQLGRIRHKNPLRAHIAATYLLEMSDAITEMQRVLRPGGHLVLIMANNRICGDEFRTQDFVRTLATRQGLALRLHLVDEITSRGLMTRRNTTAGVIERESVFLFEKPKR